jgi:hypothetical protein
MGRVDPLLLIGVLMLGMVLGALLTRIRLRATVARMVREELQRVDSIKNLADESAGNRPDAA